MSQGGGGRRRERRERPGRPFGPERGRGHGREPGVGRESGAVERERGHGRGSGGREAGREHDRERERALWLYGRHAVAAALANPRRSCHRLLATPEALARLGDAAAGRPGLAVETADRATIERALSGSDAAHQGLALHVAPLPPHRLDRACAPKGGGDGRRPLVLALDSITDPHNVGAILRAAAAFDARAVVVPGRRSAELGGAAAKAAAGALERVPVVEVVNLARAFDELRGLGYTVVALEADAERAIDEAPLPAGGPLALVLGAEGRGLRRLVRERCDLAVRVPVSDAVESLNVAVAAGIALYALRRPAARGPDTASD